MSGGFQKMRLYMVGSTGSAGAQIGLIIIQLTVTVIRVEITVWTLALCRCLARSSQVLDGLVCLDRPVSLPLRPLSP